MPQPTRDGVVSSMGTGEYCSQRKACSQRKVVSHGVVVGEAGGPAGGASMAPPPAVAGALL